MSVARRKYVIVTAFNRKTAVQLSPADKDPPCTALVEVERLLFDILITVHDNHRIAVVFSDATNRGSDVRRQFRKNRKWWDACFRPRRGHALNIGDIEFFEASPARWRRVACLRPDLVTNHICQLALYVASDSLVHKHGVVVKCPSASRPPVKLARPLFSTKASIAVREFLDLEINLIVACEELANVRIFVGDATLPRTNLTIAGWEC